MTSENFFQRDFLKSGYDFSNYFYFYWIGYTSEFVLCKIWNKTTRSLEKRADFFLLTDFKAEFNNKCKIYKT